MLHQGPPYRNAPKHHGLGIIVCGELSKLLDENPMIVANIRNGKSGQGYLVGRTILLMPAGAREPSNVLNVLEEELRLG